MVNTSFIDQYLELGRRFWPWLIGVPLVLGVFAAIASTMLLYTAPKYTSVAHISILPTQEDVAFSKSVDGGTKKSQAASLTETHTEYLKSRPVVERALQEITRESKDQSADEGMSIFGYVIDAVKWCKNLLLRILRILNSGQFVPEDPNLQKIRSFQRSIDIESVDGTYLMQIRVTQSDPTMARDFANALANAYISISSEHATEAAERLLQRVGKKIDERERQLDQLTEQEYQYRQKTKTLNLELKRTSLLAQLQEQRGDLVEDKVSKEQLSARIDALSEQRRQFLQRGDLDRIDTEIKVASASLLELDRRIAVRAVLIDGLDAELDNLTLMEKPILEFHRQREFLESEIAKLRIPIASLSIADANEFERVRIISDAVKPRYPSFPKVIPTIVTAIVFGVFLSMLGLVLIDLWSRNIWTTVDLHRVTNIRAVAQVPDSLSKLFMSKGSTFNEAAIRDLENVGAELEIRMATSGAFENPTVYVTGFGGSAMISAAALLLASACAARNLPVSCRVNNQDEFSYPHSEKLDELLEVYAEDAEPTRAGEIDFRCLSPVSARFRWDPQNRRSQNIVCVIPTGSVEKDAVQAFQEKGLPQGPAEPFYLLVDVASLVEKDTDPAAPSRRGKSWRKGGEEQTAAFRPTVISSASNNQT